MSLNNTEETKMYVVEGAPVDDAQTTPADDVQTSTTSAPNTDNLNIDQISDEEIQEFYEENKDCSLSEQNIKS
jgi:hypothetical protein